MGDGGSWEGASLAEVRKAYKGTQEVPQTVEKWLGKGWRVRKQGHGYALWPPDPGLRWAPPPAPFVRFDHTPRGDGKSQARVLDRACLSLEKTISELRKDVGSRP
jgi:hypothetical protein